MAEAGYRFLGDQIDADLGYSVAKGREQRHLLKLKQSLPFLHFFPDLQGTSAPVSQLPASLTSTLDARSSHHVY